MTMQTPVLLDDKSLQTDNGHRGTEHDEKLPPEQHYLADKELPKIAKVACRFAAARHRPAVVYVLGAGDDAEDRPDVPITQRTIEQLANALGQHSFDDLDVIIQSSGGDIHAAYHMMSLLRGHMNHEKGGKQKGTLVACVPGTAQSSATLLCLGADRILLGELGSLGPLDAQIRKGVTDVGTPDYKSALHLLKGINRLQQFALESFNAMAANLYAHQVPRDDLLRYGVDFAGTITAPLFARVDAESVGYWDQMLLTGETYGVRLLKRGDLVDTGSITVDVQTHIKNLVHSLVFEYPSHEVVIDAGVLKDDLHLKADLFDKHLRPIVREFASCASETLIMVVDPTGKAALAKSPEKIELKQWGDIGKDGSVKEFLWRSGATTCAMRVGVYRSIMKPRNPWHERTTRTRDGGPATQFSVPRGYLG